MRMQRVQHDLERFLDAACSEPLVREPLFGVTARAGATPSGLSEAAERAALDQRRRFDTALSGMGVSSEVIVYDTGADLEAAFGTERVGVTSQRSALRLASHVQLQCARVHGARRDAFTPFLRQRLDLLRSLHDDLIDARSRTVGTIADAATAPSSAATGTSSPGAAAVSGADAAGGGAAESMQAPELPGLAAHRVASNDISIGLKMLFAILQCAFESDCAEECRDVLHTIVPVLNDLTPLSLSPARAVAPPPGLNRLGTEAARAAEALNAEVVDALRTFLLQVGGGAATARSAAQAQVVRLSGGASSAAEDRTAAVTALLSLAVARASLHDLLLVVKLLLNVDAARSGVVSAPRAAASAAAAAPIRHRGGRRLKGGAHSATAALAAQPGDAPSSSSSTTAAAAAERESAASTSSKHPLRTVDVGKPSRAMKDRMRRKRRGSASSVSSDRSAGSDDVPPAMVSITGSAAVHLTSAGDDSAAVYDESFCGSDVFRLEGVGSMLKKVRDFDYRYISCESV